MNLNANFVRLSDALACVLGQVGDEEIAKSQIFQGLQMEDVLAQAQTFKVRERGYGALDLRGVFVDAPVRSFVDLEAAFWTKATVAWETDSASWATEFFDSEELPKHYWGEPIRRETAEGIHLRTSDLKRLWPESELLAASVTSAFPPERSSPRNPAVSSNLARRGGRPFVHDWARAGAFLASYVIENDYPEHRADLVRVLVNWFDQRGSAPDKRDVERFISAMYEARHGKT